MAPTIPAHRTSQPKKSILKTQVSQITRKPDTNSESLFASSKKDKRRIKHAQLISKVSKSQSIKARRRRPNKKLVATLDSLADALPDDGGENGSEERRTTTSVESQVNIIRRKSAKSRPGALKRREKLDNEERERFVKNLAQMTGSNDGTILSKEKGVLPEEENSAATPSQKWAALRGFISQTLEKRTDLGMVT